jgi:hypothetical protein
MVVYEYDKKVDDFRSTMGLLSVLASICITRNDLCYCIF